MITNWRISIICIMNEKGSSPVSLGTLKTLQRMYWIMGLD